MRRATSRQQDDRCRIFPEGKRRAPTSCSILFPQGAKGGPARAPALNARLLTPTSCLVGRRSRWGRSILLVVLIAAAGPARADGTLPGQAADLSPPIAVERVASFFDAMPTGVTVASNGRIFVNYPHWGDQPAFSVAELKNGKAVAYPDAAINTADPGRPRETFLSVQSVVADAANRLWVLDTAAPRFAPPDRGWGKARRRRSLYKSRRQDDRARPRRDLAHHLPQRRPVRPSSRGRGRRLRDRQRAEGPGCHHRRRSRDRQGRAPALGRRLHLCRARFRTDS